MGKKKHHQADRHERRQAFVNTHRTARRGPSWTVVLLGAAFLVFVVTLVISSTRSPASVMARGDTETLPAGRDITLSASTFDDGRARFYRYTTSIGRDVAFFVMKSSDGVVRAAFDACDVCYRERKGYRQSGDVMICNNCGKAFRSVDINVLQGGCNPAPIERSVQADQILLKAADLGLGAAYF